MMDATELFNLSSSPSFSFLLESEEDFTFGAKTSPFLPPATTTTTAAVTHDATTATYSLPDWMEGREFLEMPAAQFEEELLPLQSPSALEDNLLKLDAATENEEEDYHSTIKPEDMLVPLSELLPPHTPPHSPPLLPSYTPPTPPLHPPVANTPPVSPVRVAVSPRPIPVQVPASTQPTLPKIIICRKVPASAAPQARPIQVSYQVIPAKQKQQVTSFTPATLPPPQVTAMTLGNNQTGHARAPQVSPTAQAAPQKTQETPTEGCDAEQLIDEMVQMISSGGSSFQDLACSSFDSSVMEASMDDLLSQLESSEPDTVILDPHMYTTTEPESSSVSRLALPPTPTSLPSPRPCKSPMSIPIPSPSPQPSESSISSSLLSPNSESQFPVSPISLPSPVPSIGSLSPRQSSIPSPSPCFEDTFDMDEEWSPFEETHSYSKSQRKAKSSRKGSARKAPYPEDRKERKKEQNKQAALRYRQKKRQEEDEMMDKVRAEEERQRKLKATYSGLKQELSYLKKIMREVFMAKGLLSEEALKKAALEKKKSKRQGKSKE